jgi:hypothetical protein
MKGLMHDLHFLYKYSISVDDVAIFRVGDVPEHGVLPHDFKHPMKLLLNVEESCMYPKIYGVGL